MLENSQKVIHKPKISLGNTEFGEIFIDLEGVGLLVLPPERASLLIDGLITVHERALKIISCERCENVQ